MNYYDILGYTSPDGDIICIRCAERDDEKLDAYTPYKRMAEGYSSIFVGSEWDSYPSCDECHDELDDVSLTTDGRDWLGRRSLDVSLQTLWDTHNNSLPNGTYMGAYPILYHDNFGGTYCGDCATEEAKEGTLIVCGNTYDEGPIISCDRCMKDVESSYGDPDEYDQDNGDITTEDHQKFYQYGKLVVTVPEDSDWRLHVRSFMESEAFYPSVFFISDHGNVTPISME